MAEGGGGNPGSETTGNTEGGLVINSQAFTQHNEHLERDRFIWSQLTAVGVVLPTCICQRKVARCQLKAVMFAGIMAGFCAELDALGL